VRDQEQHAEQRSALRGAMTMHGRELFHRIEENGLIIIAGMITLLYWLIDSLITDQKFTRTVIALSICIYGAFTQYLISSQRAAKKALQEAHHELEQRSLQIEATSRKLEEINKKLELAYAWMRDSRDDMRQYMYEEDIGFLTDKEGQIEGITERALDHTGKSRETLIGSNIMDLLHDSCREDFRQELPQAWKGLTLHLNVRFGGQKDPEKIYEAKLTRMTVSGKRLLLAILH
jgi:PAS domain-containing protein